MKYMTAASVVALALAGALSATAAVARDQIRIVGSSTVYPFTTAVAEQFGKTTGMATPIVESTGTGGGMKLFCAGVGVDHPDATNASRRIKAGEFEDCKKNGVTDVIELKIGFDGLTLANSKKGPLFNLTKTQIFLALAKEIPGADGKLIPNPNKSWSDVDKALPNEPILVLGPPPTSGTRDSFVELVMEKGAEGIDSLKAMKKADAKAFEKVWKSIREDGAFVEAGENDNLIVKKLEADPKSLGIFGFSFLEENAAQLQGSVINGNEPTFENIADGKYTVARPLFVYIKKQHIGVIPGLDKFMAEYVSDKAIGDEGYLSDKGLVTLPAAMLEEVRAGVAAATTLTGEGL
ncbi:MAG: PstS family phosphate ABC transporter substrate-binding protein [Labrys sp. (in: a-proteobacteria)]